jgi:hypothetical protein
MDFNRVNRVAGQLLLFFCETRLTLNFNNNDKKLNCFSH